MHVTHYYTERIACILCMHLGACRFFTHPIALMHLKSILSKCLKLHFIFFAHTRMGFIENYYKRFSYITQTLINETAVNCGFNLVCNGKPKAAIKSSYIL